MTDTVKGFMKVGANTMYLKTIPKRFKSITNLTKTNKFVRVDLLVMLGLNTFPIGIYKICFAIIFPKMFDGIESVIQKMC